MRGFMRLRGWAFAGAAAAVLALVCAVDARSQALPGGAVPYQSNHPEYHTNAPVIGRSHSATGAVNGGPTFACAPSPMGTQAVRNPGSAGPALTGNNNNCLHAPGTGVVGPH
jgi:hypothetical protein